MSKVTEVRPAREADLAALARLLVVQLREHGNGLEDSELTAALEGLMRRPQSGRLLVACERSLSGEAGEEKVVGFAALSFLWTLEHGGRAAWLDELYVLPAHRGAGLGAKLLHAALGAAAEAGARAVDLEVDGAHQRAAALYRRAGFLELPRTRWVRALAGAQGGGARGDAAREARSAERTGGCFCGAIRYRLRDAARVSHCHCGMCRRISGAAVVTWVTVPRDAYAVLQGTPSELRSSSFARRTFCASCGTPLTFARDERPEEIDVTVGSLDDPSSMPPDDHVWTSSRVSWLALDDALPRHGGD